MHKLEYDRRLATVMKGEVYNGELIQACWRDKRIFDDGSCPLLSRIYTPARKRQIVSKYS